MASRRHLGVGEEPVTVFRHFCTRKQTLGLRAIRPNVLLPTSRGQISSGVNNRKPWLPTSHAVLRGERTDCRKRSVLRRETQRSDTSPRGISDHQTTEHRNHSAWIRSPEFPFRQPHRAAARRSQRSVHVKSLAQEKPVHEHVAQRCQLRCQQRARAGGRRGQTSIDHGSPQGRQRHVRHVDEGTDSHAGDQAETQALMHLLAVADRVGGSGS